jgi:hypothetical protein
VFIQIDETVFILDFSPWDGLWFIKQFVWFNILINPEIFVRPYTLVKARSRLIPEAILPMAFPVVRLVTTREKEVPYFFNFPLFLYINQQLTQPLTLSNLAAN